MNVLSADQAIKKKSASKQKMYSVFDYPPLCAEGFEEK